MLFTLLVDNATHPRIFRGWAGVVRSYCLSAIAEDTDYLLYPAVLPSE